MTIFGLNCKYENEFPTQLLGRLAPEEFARMIARINQILKRSIPQQVKLLWAKNWLICFTGSGGKKRRLSYSAEIKAVSTFLLLSIRLHENLYNQLLICLYKGITLNSATSETL